MAKVVMPMQKIHTLTSLSSCIQVGDLYYNSTQDAGIIEEKC